jgi:ABC-type multidrug transport system ATPase subunit
MKGRTSIIIAHRLTTIMDADKIVVIKRGKIREIGTHDELLQKPNGVYRKLAKRQLLLDEASRYGSMENSLESSMENLTRIETVSDLNFVKKVK